MVWSEAFKRNQLMREQHLHIRSVQLTRISAVVYEYESSELMMTQHRRLLSKWG